jgi:hypothetical protein
LRRWYSRAADVRALRAVTLAFFLAPALAAQDPFEIEVYRAQTLARSEWEVQAQLNHVARGTPSNHTHLTFELSRGLSDSWEVAGYLLGASRPDAGAELAGARLRSRVRLLAAWKSPVAAGINAELKLTRAAYAENSVAFEVSPIISARAGRFRIDLNAGIERGLKQSDSTAAEEWEFEPSAQIETTVTRHLVLGLEYHGQMGEAAVHQLFPTATFRVASTLLWNVGVGFGLTGAGPQLVFTSGLEVSLDDEREGVPDR